MGEGPEPHRAGVEDLISGLLGLMSAVLGSGHQEVVVFSSLPDGFKT